MNDTPLGHLLNLADNLAGPRETLHHLLALLPSADRVVALLEQVIELAVAVHVLQQLALHFVFGVSVFVSFIYRYCIQDCVCMEE